jgi:filamentous hemagglutinin family protein
MANTITITGGTTTGTNLFHSFQQFGLNAGQTANFMANPAIQNILGRVTGGQASVIDGRIQVTGGNANLYLMNPAGIIFGSGATLNVPGSFAATTANGIGFGNNWFNAKGANNYAALTGNPTAFAFTMNQPGGIINAGNLAVGAGQTLMLVGGTVVSTGTLSAPSGRITVQTVPGENLVRISQPGSLLSLDLPLAVKNTVNPLPDIPATLPQLLTGGNLGNATQLTVENGVVKLTGSGIAVNGGDVVVRSATAQTATLSAQQNLTLVESQVQTTGDLNLLAKNTVQVRDSATKPVVLQAGNVLTMQGDQNIDLFALNHPASGLIAGKEMVLRSPNPISADAHYWVGGNLKFETLNGTPAKVFSPYDPIILALGDVSLGDYTGASLHILAGGNVTLGNVVINNAIAPGVTIANTINSANGNSYNGNPANTFASLAPITKADGSPLYVNVIPTLDASGNVQRIPTAANQLIINGQNPTLDVRAGIDWSKLGELPTEQAIGIALPPATSPTGANITINSIEVSGEGLGTVLLTNQYAPNPAFSGNIQVTGATAANPDASIVCSGCSISDSSLGAIVMDSRGSINLGNVRDYGGVTVDLSAIGNMNIDRLRVSGPGSGSSIPLKTSVALRSQLGSILVNSIDAGANGIDVQAAGLFQATGVLNTTFLPNIGQPGPRFPSQAGTPIGDFLISKGITPPPSQTVVVYDNSFGQNTTLLARTQTEGITPITIQYGDGSRLLLNETFPAGSGVNRIVVRGGNAAFYVGPQVTGQLVSGSDAFVSPIGLSRAPLTYEAVTPGNFLTSLEGTGLLYRNEQYEALVFGSPTFPVDASGIVGGIAIAGTDATLYSATQNRVFSEIATPTPVNSTPGTTSPGAVRSTLNGQTVDQQFRRADQNALCGSSLAVALLTSRKEAGSPNASKNTSGPLQTPCIPTADDAKILKLLGEEPQ